MTAAIVDSRENWVEYEVTLDEMLTFNDFYQSKSPAARATFRRGWLLRAITFVAAAVVAGPVLYGIAPDVFPVLAVFLVVLVVSVLAYYPVQYRRAVRQAVERHYRQDNMGTHFGRRRLTLTPDYVVNSTPYSQTITRWIGIVEVCVEPYAIYLFTSAIHAIILPSRVFADEAEFRRFASLAKDAFERARQAS